MRHKTLTPEQKAEALKMRSLGISWGKIGMRYGLTRTLLRNIIDPGYRLSRYAPYPNLRHNVSRATPPADTLAERNRVLARPMTMTATLCGDPPPGRSALDKKRGWYG